jgi:hypothetical protein
MIDSVFDFKTRLAVINFLKWHRKNLVQEVSDINHVIEYLKLGDGVECEKRSLRQRVAGVIMRKIEKWV